MEDEIATCIQPSSKDPLQYAEKFLAEPLRCGDVHIEQNVNEIFNKGLDMYI